MTNFQKVLGKRETDREEEGEGGERREEGEGGEGREGEIRYK